MSTVEAFDSASLRKITQKALDVAAEIAALTATPQDDKIVAQVKNLVDSDLVWALIGRYIFRQITSDGPTAEPTFEADLAAAAPTLDPLTIIGIINLAIPLIKALWELFQRRNSQPEPAPSPDVA